MLACFPFSHAMSHLFRVLLTLLLVTMAPLSATAQSTAAPADKMDQLITLLNDPEVQALLKEKGVKAAPAETSETEVTVLVQDVRTHFQSIIAAAATLPSDLGKVGAELWSRAGGAKLPLVAVLLLVVVAAGYAADRLMLRLLNAHRAGPGTEGASKHEAQLAKLSGPPAFALAFVVAFVILPWPEGVPKLILPWLLAAMGHYLISRVTRWIETLPETVGRPDRVAHWCAAVRRFALVFLVGWATIKCLIELGLPPISGLLVAYVFSAGLLLVAIGAVWTRPVIDPSRIVRWQLINLGLTIYLGLLGGLWLADLTIALWLGIYALIMPALLPLVTRTARAIYMSRTGGAVDPAADIRMVMVDRCARLVVIALAISWFAVVVKARAARNAATDEMTQFLYGLGQGIAVLIAADFAWQLIKAWLLRLEARVAEANGTPAEIAHRGRVRTLLPMVRNFIAAVIATVTVLMVLSSLGVSIAPLIAGAGVFGVAIGFGSQTLVKDIVSGVFYMLDDAFRVGEYIQTGSYRGTVESFSVRSIRLRHHRGSIYTVPFGSLGAVQNMSRDWAKDKFTITVPFDTDLEKVRKIAKQVGLTLKADPELGDHIIEPIKMKGVEQIGDYGLILGFGMMVKPSGQQTVIRRKAYAMLKQEFKERGIAFASPTVQVAGDEPQSVAAGHAAKMLAEQKALAAAGGAAG